MQTCQSQNAETLFKTTRGKLLRFSIYLLPLVSFSFWKPGYGFLQPTQFLLTILAISFISSSSSEKTKAFSKKSQFFIFNFWYLVFFSFILSSISGNFVSFNRSFGVIISLVLFFLSYSTVSRICDNFHKSLILIEDFVNAAALVSFTVLIEYLSYNLFNNRITEIVVNQVYKILPYSHFGFSSLAPLRYKGILPEPGDVGYFCLPALAYLLFHILPNLLSRSYPNVKTKQLFYVISMSLACLLTQSLVVIVLLVIVILIAIGVNLDRKSLTNLSKFNKAIIATFLVGGFLFFNLFTQLDKISETISIRIQDSSQLWSQVSSGSIYDSNSSTLNRSTQVAGKSLFATVEALRINPVLGVGLGNFSVAYDLAGSQLGIETEANKHDGYLLLLRLLTELGLLGTAFFVLCFWSRLSESVELSKFVNYYEPQIATKTDQNPLQKIMPILLAACVAMIYAFVGQASYWYPIIPILFGLCPRSYHSFSRFSLEKSR